MRERAESRQQIARGVLLGITYDGDAHAEAPGGFALGYGLDRVIGSLCVDVRSQEREQARHVGLFEYHHVTDGGKTGNETCARFGGKYRAALPLQRSYARVGVDRHDEHVSFTACPFEVSGMPDVQHIEAAIGQHNLFSAIFVLPKLEGQGLKRQNFISGVHFSSQGSPYR